MPQLSDYFILAIDIADKCPEIPDYEQEMNSTTPEPDTKNI